MKCSTCDAPANIAWLHGESEPRCAEHWPAPLEGGLLVPIDNDIDWGWIQQVKDAAQKSSAALDAWSDPSVPVMGSEREAHNLASCEFDEALGYAEGAVLRLIGYIEKLSGRLPIREPR